MHVLSSLNAILLWYHAGHELLVSTKHDSTIISGMFFLLKALGAKLLKNQEESLKDIRDHQMVNTLGKRVVVEETN